MDPLQRLSPAARLALCRIATNSSFLFVAPAVALELLRANYVVRDDSGACDLTAAGRAAFNYGR